MKQNKLAAVFKIVWLEAAIIVAAILIDLLTKYLIDKNMELYDTVEIIPGFLQFFYTLNTKAAFSFDFWLTPLIGEEGVRIFFIVLTIVALGFFCWLLFKFKKCGYLYRIALALIIGGAIGNLYDRIFLGCVRDFIQIVYFGAELFGSKSFAVFNIADSCVVVGVILFLVYLLFFDKVFVKHNDKIKGDAASDVETSPKSFQDDVMDEPYTDEQSPIKIDSKDEDNG